MAIRPFRNLGLKLAALGLGSLLWFTVTGERVERKILRVPIVYRNLPESLEITDQPDSVDVSVRGSYAEVSLLQGIAVTADLSGATPGQYDLPLRVDQVGVPPGVEVVQITPSVVPLYLERTDVRDVMVEPSIDGEPAAGFAVTSVSVDPAMVAITGPQSRLRPTITAVTERISIEGASSTLTRTVSVRVGDAQLRLVEAGRVTVTVTIVIEPVPVSRTFDRVPLRFPNRGAGLEVLDAPETVSVTVRGSRADVAALPLSSIEARIDLAGLGPGQHSLDVVVRLPGTLEVERVEPSLVTLRIR